MIFLNILNNIVLPVFTVIGIGFLIGKAKHPDPKTLSIIAIFILGPMLVFSTVNKHDLRSDEVTTIFSFIGLHTVVMLGLCTLLLKALNINGPHGKTLLLTMMIINSGNYPVPLNYFAYGETGKYYALLIMVGNIMVSVSLGVYLASGGKSFKRSLAQVFKLPLFYAAFGAVIFNKMGLRLITFLDKGIEFGAQAALPMDLVLLGILLSTTSFDTKQELRVGHSLLTCGVRLIASPLVAAVLLYFLGVKGQMFKSMIITAAMPTAVYTSILVTYFGGDRGFVARTIFLSTLISVPTITVIIWLLG